MSIFYDGGAPNGTSADQSLELTKDVAKGEGETFDWDSLINGDTQAKPLLPEGDYGFKVVDFGRNRFSGSAKLPPANKATLTLRIEKDGRTTDIKSDIILVKLLEWKIVSFFRSIGHMKKGEEFRMDWSRVIGAEGRAHIVQRTFRGNDGKDHTVNEVEKYLDPTEEEKTPTLAPGSGRNY